MSDNAEFLNAILDLKTHIDGRFERLEQQVDRMAPRLDGAEQRLYEQSRILAALIPTRVAAVPPAAE
ncbi:hypothetical protein SAMN02982917_5094 [Azospirillum oryzae]|uniref:Uncharacterized protein n=1 Tax=Azospirillum oryzae TaxID=286727 RepID=A0A1X7H7I8_9PROT|nr:hypothetical protein [Azospirillum oryzae]SMF80687.1 hypothetical protein SAMN02982917_5094 [Azospirillum oryzae]